MFYITIISEKFSYSFIKKWFKLFAVTGGAQLIIQAIGFVCGIIVIRLLPTQEYALYTLVYSMSGTLNMLSDGGISLGVMAEGGKVWADKNRLGIVLSTGLNLRKRFALLSLTITFPVLFYLLWQHGASILMSIILIASLVPAFYTTLSGTLLEIPIKLHQKIAQLQKIQVVTNLSRMALLFLTIFIFPWAFIAILAAGLPQIWANKRLRTLCKSVSIETYESDKLVRKNILLLVSRILPDAAYYSISGQISLWLISFFGTTASIAQFGAMGRLGMLLNVFIVGFTTLGSPRFAKLKNNRKVLYTNFIIVLIILVLLSLVTIFATSFFASQILRLLGNKYYGLDNELILLIMSSCIALFVSIPFTICTSRGRAVSPFISIPISIISIIIGCFIFNIGTLVGVLKLNIFTTLISAFIHTLYTFYIIEKYSVYDK